MKKIGLSLAIGCLLTLVGHGAAFGKGSVINSPHNLSASGPGGVVFAEEKRICVFCHVPHNTASAGPLWSRALPAPSIYTKPYDSTTLKAQPKPDKPLGASRLCLSCHDGTIALNAYVGSPITTNVYMPSDPNPTKNFNLTSDLSDDHPISFAYTDALASLQGQLAPPAALPPQIKLEPGAMLECTACHDPHDNEFGNFLVIDNKLTGAPLCVACHKNTGWGTSAHNPSVTSSLGLACENCHYAHNAPGRARLLHSSKDEENCYISCHNSSSPPAQNVASIFTDTTLYRHPVNDPGSSGVHDEAEALPVQNYHVQCVDCHNPHQANGTNMPLSIPPNINGPLLGVRKDSMGTISTTEYDICYKCHSGPQAFQFFNKTDPPNRQVNEPDESKRFDGPNTASYHPVMDLRRGTGSSLVSPYNTNMKMIYCSDCHNSDKSGKAGGAGPNGPHGSIYPHILIARYDMPLAGSPAQSYSASFYALCYRCHSESYIMGAATSGFVNKGKSEHFFHVQQQGYACFVCHDPHGISLSSVSTPPPSVQGNAHLINFRMDYVSGPLTPSYTTTVPRTGSCTVNCHKKNGGTHNYSP